MFAGRKFTVKLFVRDVRFTKPRSTVLFVNPHDVGNNWSASQCNVAVFVIFSKNAF